MTRVSPVLRGMGIGLWMLLIAGPSPGAVGSCSGDDDLDKPASLRDYCRAREQLLCVRGQMRREYTIDAQDDCRRDALERCRTRFWYPSCKPTVRQTQACLTALSLVDTLQTPVEEIGECNSAALACVDTSESESESEDGGVAP